MNPNNKLPLSPKNNLGNLKSEKLKHKKAHINRSAMEQAMHYNLLLQGASETLIKKAGYKTFKPEEKKK